MAKLVRVDRGNWANSTDYLPGDYAKDVPSGVIWNCTIIHTSAATGTFAEDRVAHDKGNWTNNTPYAYGEIATDSPTGKKYFCTLAHTSAPTGSFEADRITRPGYWLFTPYNYWELALQAIPADWLDEYRATLTENLPADATRKRYPFRIPLRQKFGYKVSAKQQEQRNRWLEIKTKFKNIPWEVRQRWYAARPPWASLLWYYNYFMMSGLMGNAVVGDKGGGVIKDINHYGFTIAVGTAPQATINVDPCDPQKSVPFFFGAGYFIAGENIPVANYPYLVSLGSSQMVVGMSMPNEESTRLGVTLIEYI